MQQKFKVLPQTPWTAHSYWQIEKKPLYVLLLSLSIMGVGEGLLLLSDLGSAPWTVLSQGAAVQWEVNIGWTSLIISILVMLMWFPLKLKAGWGTLLNILLIALFLGLTSKTVPLPTALWERLTYAFIGILLFGIGSAFYLTCHQGAGPRDGLMVGLCQRFHWKIGIVRTVLEISVCLAGYLLGGTVGIGTLLFAAAIGWVVHWTVIFIHRVLRTCS